MLITSLDQLLDPSFPFYLRKNNIIELCLTIWHISSTSYTFYCFGCYQKINQICYHSHSLLIILIIIVIVMMTTRLHLHLRFLNYHCRQTSSSTYADDKPSTYKTIYQMAKHISLKIQFHVIWFSRLK